jgi:enoyl-CoA hydratase/carnithine racemase
MGIQSVRTSQSEFSPPGQAKNPSSGNFSRLYPEEAHKMGCMSYENIASAVEDNIGVVTLNRPARRNALSLALMRELIQCLHEINQRREIRVVILAAAGKVFSAGHDLSEMVGRDINEYREIFDVCTELMTKIQSIRQPVIAEVQGMATAAGCQLVASCDLAIASEESSFATPGVKIGLFCTTPMVALSRAVGRKRALEMLMTGTPVDARTAADWGLVNRVVPAAQLQVETRKLAAQVVAASEFVMALGKQAYYAQIDLDQPKAYAYTKEVMSMNALAADAQEGMSAFLEKRSPCWVGR